MGRLETSVSNRSSPHRKKDEAILTGFGLAQRCSRTLREANVLCLPGFPELVESRNWLLQRGLFVYSPVNDVSLRMGTTHWDQSYGGVEIRSEAEPLDGALDIFLDVNGRARYASAFSPLQAIETAL